MDSGSSTGLSNQSSKITAMKITSAHKLKLRGVSRAIKKRKPARNSKVSTAPVVDVQWGRG